MKLNPQIKYKKVYQNCSASVSGGCRGVMTLTTASGYRLNIGNFDASGLNVNDNDNANDNIGLGCRVGLSAELLTIKPLEYTNVSVLEGLNPATQHTPNIINKNLEFSVFFGVNHFSFKT